MGEGGGGFGVVPFFGVCKRCKRNSRARILSRAEGLRAYFIKKMCYQLILESFIGNFSFTPFTLGFIH